MIDEERNVTKTYDLGLELFEVHLGYSIPRDIVMNDSDDNKVSGRNYY